MATKRNTTKPAQQANATQTQPATREGETLDTVRQKRDDYLTALAAACQDGAISPEEAIEEVSMLVNDVSGFYSDTFSRVLLPEERKRMQKAGVNLLGLIQLAYKKSQEWPQFLPAWLSLGRFAAMMADFNEKQKVYDSATVLLNIAHDALRVASYDVYHAALAFYSEVKVAAAHQVPGAEALAAELAPYFKKRKPPKGDQPTAKQVESDVRALLKGSKDGRVVVENTKATTVPGVRRVIDETGGGRRDGEIKLD